VRIDFLCFLGLTLTDPVPDETALVRSAVERVFADWKCRRSMARCRYVGLAKNQLHFSLLAIAHNMRRMAVLCG
jgi:IS5 family transposase